MGFIQLFLVLGLLVLGFTSGTLIERAHFRRLAIREAAVSHILVTDLRQVPEGVSVVSSGMVFGEVVIASDYFKTFAAKLRGLIGGNLRTFESLMERARRESLVRLKESAHSLQASHVINIRFETANIGSMRGKKGAAMVEVFAFGTALRTSEA